MQKRICPNCFKRWYSANSSQVLSCGSCGHDIPVPKDEQLVEIKILAKGGE